MPCGVQYDSRLEQICLCLKVNNDERTVNADNTKYIVTATRPQPYRYTTLVDNVEQCYSTYLTYTLICTQRKSFPRRMVALHQCQF